MVIIMQRYSVNYTVSWCLVVRGQENKSFHIEKIRKAEINVLVLGEY